MADVFTREERSRVMATVKSTDTTPERKVRSIVHRLGYRFRLHRKDLPGNPDIVLPRHRKVIFVHGCFWHQHPRCSAADRPASNTEYWNKKLNRNIQRDRKNLRALRKDGWQPLVVWECQLKNEARTEAKIRRFLEHS